MSLHKRSVMSLDESIRRRRSVRGFLPDEVPETTLRGVFELAQFAPSNCNVQPWTPHVVSGAKLRKLREALVAAGMRDEPVKPDWPAEGKFSGVHRDRQVDAAQKLYGAMGVERRDLVGRKMAYIRNHAFFDAPHAVFIFMPVDAGADGAGHRVLRSRRAWTFSRHRPPTFGRGRQLQAAFRHLLRVRRPKREGERCARRPRAYRRCRHIPSLNPSRSSWLRELVSQGEGLKAYRREGSAA